MKPKKADMVKEIEPLLVHMNPAWGNNILCDVGWYPIILKLHREIKSYDSNYEIHQIKEKFGILRFYYAHSWGKASTPEQEVIHRECENIAGIAALVSSKTCELCGLPGLITKNNLNIKTLCGLHAAEKGFNFE